MTAINAEAWLFGTFVLGLFMWAIPLFYMKNKQEMLRAFVQGGVMIVTISLMMLIFVSSQ